MPEKQSKAIIVGAGPNGLTAAARLAIEGWDVEIYERSGSVGGAARSTSGIFGDRGIVDIGAASHPFGIASPAFRELCLEDFGLEWVNSTYAMAHPLDSGDVGLLSTSLSETAEMLDQDSRAWVRLHANAVNHIDSHLENFLGPILRPPRHPLRMMQFGIPALASAEFLGKSLFTSEKARALFAGSAVHAITSPARPLTGAFGLLFGALGMTRGWPSPVGGTQSVIDALLRILQSENVRIHLNAEVVNLRDLPQADAIILNLTPKQILRLRGLELSQSKRNQLETWRYGTATFKVDFLLSDPVPWTDGRVGHAGTVHLGGTVPEIVFAEEEAAAGRMPERPFVMVHQPYVADPMRGNVLWSYAHVPSAYKEPYPGQVRETIIRQIERFAPDFRDVILETHEVSPAQLEEWNPNIIGGDIAGGSMSGSQMLIRPGIGFHPHKLSHNLYMASSSTPPGAGVHGMPGWWAAHEVMVDSKNRF